MDIILSTRNPGKMGQIRALFAPLPNVTILSLGDARIEGEAVEDGTTFEENALKKAVFANERSGLASIADDTGVFINALGGEPGIRAARWAGDVSTEEIMYFTLKKLEGKADRSGYFKTAAVFMRPSGEHSVFLGEVRGTFLERPRTLCPPKMPYSAIFVPDGRDKTWSEMTIEEENAISHRGIAFRKLLGSLSPAIY